MSRRNHARHRILRPAGMALILAAGLSTQSMAQQPAQKPAAPAKPAPAKPAAPAPSTPMVQTRRSARTTSPWRGR